MKISRNKQFLIVNQHLINRQRMLGIRNTAYNIFLWIFDSIQLTKIQLITIIVEKNSQFPMEIPIGPSPFHWAPIGPLPTRIQRKPMGTHC